MFSTGAGVVANPNNPPDPPGTVGSSTYTPGDPNQVDTSAFDNIPESRSLPWPTASPWSGWPAEWSTPTFNTQLGINRLIDIAWACIDLNSSVLAAMPVYRMRAGNVIPPTAWMTNPDPDIYTCWQEFAKQLFWDYMLGEAFVLPFATSRTDGYPLRFRVIPPHLVDVEMRSGARQYKLGAMDVTDEILHIRYSSTTTTPRGQGPLEITGARQVAIGLLQRYANHLAETGGIPLSWLELERRITEGEGTDLLDRWIESRTKYAGYPALVSGGAKLMQGKAMNAIDMALLELSQFNEARIAIMMGVPPFLVGLPGATGSLTYSNIESLFSYHDRSSLRPKANAVMFALGNWALPAGQSVELNRDDYTRPTLADRATSYEKLIRSGVLTPDEARAMERLQGDAAASQLTGGLD